MESRIEEMLAYCEGINTQLAFESDRVLPDTDLRIMKARMYVEPFRALIPHNEQLIQAAVKASTLPTSERRSFCEQFLLNHK